MHSAAVRRLTGNEHLGVEFATEWPLYDLDEKTRALLAYAAKLTDTPGMVADADIEALRAAGWDDRGIWQATALVNMEGPATRCRVVGCAAPGRARDRVELHAGGRSYG